jgi:hypothetical protein
LTTFIAVSLSRDPISTRHQFNSQCGSRAMKNFCAKQHGSGRMVTSKFFTYLALM